MGNKPTGYWIMVLVVLAAIVASFMMRSSADPHMRDISKYLAYGAIVIYLIGRFFIFRSKPDTMPPMPKD